MRVTRGPLAPLGQPAEAGGVMGTNRAARHCSATLLREQHVFLTPHLLDLLYPFPVTLEVTSQETLYF